MNRVVIPFTVAAISAAVLTSCASTAEDPSAKPSQDGLHLSNFTVVDGSWQRWFVGKIQRVTVEDSGNSVEVYYEAGPKDCKGLVGYAMEWRETSMIVRLVEGMDQDFCEGIGYPTTLTIPLDRPLEGRSALPQPQRDVNADVARP